MRFQNKSQLLNYIVSHAPSASIARGIDWGTTELYGGFTRIPPSRHGGWIVKVASKWGGVWLVAVLTGPGAIEGHVIVIDKVPWKYWRGNSAQSKAAIGDNPTHYITKEAEANSE